MNDLITVREVAERLAMSPAWVLDRWEAGELPGFRIGGRKGGPVRFRWPEVEAVLESWRCGPQIPVAPSDTRLEARDLTCQRFPAVP